MTAVSLTYQIAMAARDEGVRLSAAAVQTFLARPRETLRTYLVRKER